MPGQHPDADHTDGNSNGENFCQGESPTEPQGYFALGGTGSHKVLTHGQEEKGQSHGGNHGGADSEQQLETGQVRSGGVCLTAILGSPALSRRKKTLSTKIEKRLVGDT